MPRKAVKEIVRIIRFAPATFIAAYCFALLSSVCAALSGIIAERVFGAVLTSEQIVIARVLTFLCLMALAQIGREITFGISEYLIDNYDLQVQQMLGERLQEAAGNACAERFEEPAFLDRMERASDGIEGVRKLQDVCMQILLYYLPYFLIYGSYLYTRDPVLPVVFLLLLLPVILTQILRAKLYRDMHAELAPCRRKKKAFLSYLTDRKSVMEVRANDLTEMFLQKHAESGKELCNILLRTLRGNLTLDTVCRLMSMAGYLTTVRILIDAVMTGHISIAVFAAVFSNIGTIREEINDFVEYGIGAFASEYESARCYVEGMELLQGAALPESSGQIPVPETIHVNDVTFSYPGQLSPALSGIRLTLTKGNVYALVGGNGAGKTTLVKLIQGVFSPGSGEIVYVDADQKRFNRTDALRTSSAVMQDYMRYQVRLADNINMSDTGDDKKIADSIRFSGLTDVVDSLPDKENTMLGPSFGGVDLSGGQWQRLSIARAHHKSSGLICMDEPTSAMDAVNEEDFLNRIRELAADKIAVIVTHRMGLVRHCDEIIVMQEGMIAGQGSHETLHEENAIYRSLWESQASMYRAS